jgi:hypothetical protein
MPSNLAGEYRDWITGIVLEILSKISQDEARIIVTTEPMDWEDEIQFSEIDYLRTKISINPYNIDHCQFEIYTTDVYLDIKYGKYGFISYDPSEIGVINKKESGIVIIINNIISGLLCGGVKEEVYFNKEGKLLYGKSMIEHDTFLHKNEYGSVYLLYFYRFFHKELIYRVFTYEPYNII